MKSGALHIVSEQGRGLSAELAPLERREEGRTLRSTIELQNGPPQATLNDVAVADGGFDALTIAEGTVYREALAEIKSQRINPDGGLEVDDEGTEKVMDDTRYIHVEEELLLTASTDDDDARNIVEKMTASTIEQAEINIDSFASAHPDAEPALEWAKEEDGTLTVCALGEASSVDGIRDQVDASERPQYSFKGLEWEGRDLYGTITESGYVELYRDENGGSIGTEEFTRFVLEEVVEHAST